jgi:hypothetical protein
MSSWQRAICLVQPATLSALNYHRGMLMLNIPLYWAWFICNIFYSYQIWQRWTSTAPPPPKAELVCKWMVVVAFIAHIVIGAAQAREENKRKRRIPVMSKDVKADCRKESKMLRIGRVSVVVTNTGLDARLGGTALGTQAVFCI